MKPYQLRRERLKISRLHGTHTKQEWIKMKDFFQNTCVKCFGESNLVCVEKDHIIPIYQGGSDSIRNLQPMCARCNCSKGANSDDLRPFLANRLKLTLPKEYTNAY